VRAAPSVEEVWRSYCSLADADTRRAFFRTLHAVIDLGGQSVSATDRLYLTSQVPSLIVWGADDRLIPVSHAVAAHESMPGSRLEIFEGAGHYPHCENPERFVEVLVDFIGTTEAAHLSEARLRDLLQSPHVGFATHGPDPEPPSEIRRAAGYS
jgi:pimeloyl-ACP methyl ester carboxylesterase